MNCIEVTKLEKIKLEDLITKVRLGPDSDRIGCIISFIGIVRKKSDGNIVEKLHLGLDNEAEEKLRDIAREVGRKYKVINTLIYHNLDEIDSKDTVVYVIVSTEHRKEAFMALEEIVDRIKAEVHIDLKEIIK